MKNTKKNILLGALVVLAFALVIKPNLGGTSEGGHPVVEATFVHEEAPSTPPEKSVVVIGGISASADGKEMSIQMAGGSSNNFAQETWAKGETISFSVSNSQEQELEIGIMSIATEEVFSGNIRTGTGTVDIKVPEDGNYRIYIKNHSADVADFEVKLNKELLSPLV